MMVSEGLQCYLTFFIIDFFKAGMSDEQDKQPISTSHCR